ncbi:TCR gamma alternate reading frame protein isoform X7 [Piliocolobus tephrosceles]|uniref:TCR gamma alternate reading frame protein isoform X7 n=1 Tax=Piliocolobus tephrosceles TaxID=591936 RepID=UPI000E6B3307|nr:TCR gamma alternate reading frame protein isoform X7 [Piliocolobus tephrosceles]
MSRSTVPPENHWYLLGTLGICMTSKDVTTVDPKGNYSEDANDVTTVDPKDNYSVDANVESDSKKLQSQGPETKRT